MPQPPLAVPRPKFLPEPRENSSDEEEEVVPPKELQRPRKGGVCSVPLVKGYCKEPFWNKHHEWERILFESLRNNLIFKRCDNRDMVKFVRGMETHLRYDGELFVEEGERADSLIVVLEGRLACYTSASSAPQQVLQSGALVDATAVLFAYPRKYSMKACGECIVAKLCHHDYVDLSTRMNFYSRERNKYLLKGTKMLEMMEDEAVEKLCDSLKLRTLPANYQIITQHEQGKEFYIVNRGTVRVWVKTADDEQEYVRLHEGALFGELALLKDSPRAANVTAVTEVELLVLTRKQFERLLGPMTDLHQQQYLTDPRKLIADFYEGGDARGPVGSLRRHQLEVNEKEYSTTEWFAVYRPTSKDAIAKMLSGSAVGKGLNVKGKSAKKGVLSGFVPFIQISENEHKQVIEQSPPDARVIVYYKTKAAREEARKALQSVMDSEGGAVAALSSIVSKSIKDKDSYKPDAWGLDMPEPLMRHAYIMKPDLSPVMGWETGRRSEPAFMDMNLHSIRGTTEPQVVLYQNDESEAMNPRGILIAYAEAYVKPVVSDFDTFTVGSIGMDYEPLSMDQAKLMTWSLGHTKNILQTPDHKPWNSRWLEVMAKENERGFHVAPPKLGFGDPTSTRLIADVIAETAPCGAIRHGAECCNLGFPQELDEEYLVVWHGFPDKPWDYKTEEGLRKFLAETIAKGFAFPINPVWPVRDKGWYELLESMGTSDYGKKCLSSWFRSEINYFAVVKEMHDKFPNGFAIVQE
eukprot:TRINITY_DN9763_c0_g1_i1.p1 TRINITY_DN9763_c0_g1~~TRINITY_DN9763_c0_g1_i1.p1  ORF type:complete len:750 (+),score=135.52 TRINITY_DN9763_c0_g1_i1:154-2403(+)